MSKYSKHIPNKGYRFEKKDHFIIVETDYDNNWFLYHLDLQKRLSNFDLIPRRKNIHIALNDFPEFFKKISKKKAISQAKEAVKLYIPNFDCSKIDNLDDLKSELKKTEDDNKVNLVKVIDVYLKSKNS